MKQHHIFEATTIYENISKLNTQLQRLHEDAARSGVWVKDGSGNTIVTFDYSARNEHDYFARPHQLAVRQVTAMLEACERRLRQIEAPVPDPRQFRGAPLVYRR